MDRPVRHLAAVGGRQEHVLLGIERRCKVLAFFEMANSTDIVVDAAVLILDPKDSGTPFLLSFKPSLRFGWLVPHHSGRFHEL
jgi:hypothetical protein